MADFRRWRAELDAENRIAAANRRKRKPVGLSAAWGNGSDGATPYLGGGKVIA